MRVIGVDTDSKGSLAAIDDESKTVTIYYVPSHKRELKNGKKRVTLNRKVTAEYCFDIFKKPVTAMYVEEQWSRPDQDAGATFTFGCIYCALVQGLESAAVSVGQSVGVKEVHSTIWKNAFSISSDKQQARDLATKVFPKCADAWQMDVYTSAAEATLIALYGHTLEMKAAGKKPDLNVFKDYTLVLAAKRRVTLKNS